jgi:hypothetical protein
VGADTEILDRNPLHLLVLRECRIGTTAFAEATDRFAFGFALADLADIGALGEAEQMLRIRVRRARVLPRWISRRRQRWQKWLASKGVWLRRSFSAQA